MNRALIPAALLLVFSSMHCARIEKPTKEDRAAIVQQPRPGVSADISNEEAIKLIRAAKKFPHLCYISLDFGGRSPLGEEVQRLIQEGYFQPPTGSLDKQYEPSEKGKSLVGNAEFNPMQGYGGMGNVESGGRWSLQAVTHTVDVKRIVDRHADTRNDTMTLIYETEVTPTPYLDQLRKLNPRETEYGLQQARSLGRIPRETTSTNTAVLQKWESGWRVVDKDNDP